MIDAPVDGPADAAIDAPPDAPGVCSVFGQTGCNGNQRCTYLMSGTSLGVMCEPMGTATGGGTCTVDATSQLDDCVGGTVCAGGTCKPVCNTQGPDTCGNGFVCNSYSRGTGTIGACDRECDPLNDNDFDGPGSMHTKTGTVCPQPMQGCYGFPNNIGPKRTTFTCATDVNYAQQQLHHRSACTNANGCEINGNPFINGCNQGYLPLLTDMTGSSVVDCIALCKPVNCDINNCQSGQLGLVPHRCNPLDAVGMFNTANNGEQCTFWWMLEVDQTTGASIHHSPYSDTLGFCMDHSKYQYDSNGDGQITPADAFMPPCMTLPPGPGQGAGQLGAADIGCEDSTHSNLPRHAPIRTSFQDMRILGTP